MSDIEQDAQSVVENGENEGAAWFRAEHDTPEQFADAVGVRLETLWRWWREGCGPPYVQLGRKRFLRRETTRQWMASMEKHPPRSRRARP